MSRPERPQALITVLRGTAVPYGYTLTVLASHSIVSNTHGPPDVLDILLFVIGAMASFAILAGFAQLRSSRPLEPSRGQMLRVGMVHVFAIGAAFGAAALVALIPGGLAWLLGAFLATGLYLTITSLEIDFATRLDSD